MQIVSSNKRYHLHTKIAGILLVIGGGYLIASSPLAVMGMSPQSSSLKGARVQR